MRFRPIVAVAVLAAATLAAGQGKGKREPVPMTVEARPVRAVYGHLMEGPFLEPSGVYFDPVENLLYVCDLVGHRIALVNEQGVPVFSFGSSRTFESPKRVLALPDGRILVVDATFDGVRVFDFDGEPLADLDLSTAPAADKPTRVVGLALWPDGALALLDGANRRVLVVEADGETVRAFGAPALREGLMVAPQDVDVGPDGNLVISDARGLAVQVYDRQGAFVRAWGEHDAGPDQFSLPAGLAVDGSGRIFIADTLRQDIKVFTPDGAFITNFGGFGRGPGGVRYPIDVASDRRDRVYVSERLGRRVQSFEIREVPAR